MENWSTRRSLIVLALAIISIGFGIWSLRISSRYQALCEISWWTASSAELKRCDDRMAELQK